MSEYSLYYPLWCYTFGILPANVDSTIIDYGTAATAFLPAGCCINRVWVGLSPGSNPLPPGINVSVGVIGNNQQLIPLSAGLTTDIMNAGPALMTVGGFQVAPLTNASLVVNPSADITVGGFDVFAEYNYFEDPVDVQMGGDPMTKFSIREKMKQLSLKNEKVVKPTSQQ